ALLQSMIIIINLLVSIFLERTTKKNNKNSSTPSSQTDLQYGNGIKATVINFLIAQMISLNRAQKLIKSMIGKVIAEATLLKFLFRFL
ncbi:MAG TPA: hypothetical protein VHM20_07620, partial [Gammaproteobacteria bacterium]|nr:hypothetical protein [Gammaproteobacteria bacterium]